MKRLCEITSKSIDNPGINALRLRGTDVKQSPKHESKRSAYDCHQELYIDGRLAESVEVSD